MNRVWVLWTYDRGSYESIVVKGVTSSEKAKAAWLARDTNAMYSTEYGADEFEMNTELP